MIEISVVTTSGSYPEDGFISVPIHQKVRIDLDKADRALKLTNTQTWIAKADNRILNIDKSYLENGLNGSVNIDWGPRQTGGGDGFSNE